MARQALHKEGLKMIPSENNLNLLTRMQKVTTNFLSDSDKKAKATT